MITIIDELDVLKKAVIIQLNAWKKILLLLANKLIKNVADPGNAKEHYESFLRMKNRKSFKKSEIITYQPKTFENPNIDHIKSVITEHSKTSQKLFKAIKKGLKRRF